MSNFTLNLLTKTFANYIIISVILIKRSISMHKSKLINIFVYSYIALPFLIFAAGFLKLQFAIPVSLCIVFSIIFATYENEGLAPLPISRRTALTIAAGVALITLMVFLSGIGNVLWQNNDHATRNAFFDVLVNYSWPPKYSANASGEVGIVYYLGFWLPSALMGKLFGLGFGYAFQIIWAIMGLCILWYLLCVMHKKIVIYPLVIFLFFGGMDLIGHRLVDAIYPALTSSQIGAWAYPGGSAITTHIEWWAAYYQYSSHTTQLFWVFNQCIPVWIATVLLILEKNNKNLVLIMGLTLLSSTLPFVGLIPVFVWCAVCDHNESSLLDRPFTRDVKKSFFSLFTFQNVIGGGLSGVISFIYLIGNIASVASSSKSSGISAPASFSVGIFVFTIIVFCALYLVATANAQRKISHILYFIPMPIIAFLLAKTSGTKLELYLLFVIFEFILLSLLIIPAYGKSSLFFTAVACLLIIPFFKVGTSIDFCMRASIPLLVVMCLFSIQSLKKYFDEDRQVLATLLCAVLMLGALTPVKEIARTVEATVSEIQATGSVQNDRISEERLFSAPNFTGKTKDSLFFEIFAK